MLSLAKSLQLDVTADADSLAVTLNGVRMAFFDADGSYLPPINADGTVYVPLVAFAESAGIGIDEADGGYALQRKRGVSAAAAAAATPAAIELYGYVPLGMDNYGEYFTLSQDYSAPAGYPSTYRVTYTAAIRATTGYSPINVRFSLESYGTVVLPASGYASASYSSETISGNAKDRDYILKVADLQTAAILTAALPPNVRDVSGSLRMSKAEADQINENDYQQAYRQIHAENPGSAALASSARVLDRLATVNYRDSGEQARYARSLIEAAKQQEAEEAAAAAEQRNADAYRAAQQAFAEGRHQAAYDGFAELAEKQYGDSAAQMQLVRDAWNEADYQAALQALNSGDYDGAIAGFAELAQKNYADSKDQLRAAKQAREEVRIGLYEDGYLAAAALLESGRFTEAESAFEPLAAAEYKDSARMLSVSSRARSKLAEWTAAYQKGIAAEAQQDWDAALSAFLSVPDFRNAQAHAVCCALVNRNILRTIPSEAGSFFFQYGKGCAWASTATGVCRGFPDTKLVTDAPGFWQADLTVVEKNRLYGILGADGQTVLPLEYRHPVMIGRHYFCAARTDESGLLLFDLHGAPVTDGGKQVVITSADKPVQLPYGSLYPVSGGGRILFLRDGGFRIFSGQESPLYANDGLLYAVRTEGNVRTLYAPDGTALYSADGFQTGTGGDTTSSGEPYQLYNGVVAFRKNGKWGLYDTVRQKVVAKPAWDNVCSFTEGGALRVVKNHKYGLVSAAGKTLAKISYESIAPFCHGLARVHKTVRKTLTTAKSKVAQYGFINEKGKLVIPMDYLRSGDFSAGFGYTWVEAYEGRSGKNDSCVSFSLISDTGKKLFTTTDKLSYAYNPQNGVSLPIRGLVSLPVQNTTVSLYAAEDGGSGKLRSLGNSYDRQLFSTAAVTAELALIRIDKQAYRSNPAESGYLLINAKGETVRQWYSFPNQTVTPLVTDSGILFTVSKEVPKPDSKAGKTMNQTTYELYLLAADGSLTVCLPPDNLAVPITENSPDDLAAVLASVQ